MRKIYIQIFLMAVVMETAIAWKPNPGPQTVALTRSEYEILYGGARGGGKTDAGLVWMVEPKYVTNPLYRGLVIRKNSDDLSDWIARAKVMYRGLHARVTGGVTGYSVPERGVYPDGAFEGRGGVREVFGA